MPVEPEAGYGSAQKPPQLIPQRLYPHRFCFQIPSRNFTGFAQAGDVGDILGSGPQTPFVPGPQQHRSNRRTLAHVQHPHSLGGVELVSRHGEQVYPQIIYPNGNLAHGLSGVGVDQCSL